MDHLFIFGCGYSGKYIAQSFQSSGSTVAGTTRSHDHFSAIEKVGATPVTFENNLTPEIIEQLQNTTHLVQSIAPNNESDPVLRLLPDDLSSLMPKLKWICYLSTIGVYGDHKGAVVDESTKPQPSHQRSKDRLSAEAAWLRAGEKNKIATAILRLAGIYGPGRNAIENVRNGSAQRIVKEGQVFNRIRVEDIARAVLFLARNETGGVYNLTDDEPAPPQDVVTEAASLLGKAPPPEVLFEKANLSPMGRSFYEENKRASNGKIKQLGFQFLYPNYKMSLKQLAAD